MSAEFDTLVALLHHHGFEVAGKDLKAWDVADPAAAIQLWQTYPECLAHHPVRLRPPPKRPER